MTYFRSISAIPRAYQLSQGNISCPKAISALPKQYQLSQSNISYPKAISDIPRAHQIPPENMISKPSHQKMIRIDALILICRKKLENKNRLLCFLSKILNSYPRRREIFVFLFRPQGIGRSLSYVRGVTKT